MDSAGLLRGKTLGVDSTTLGAKAAMRSMVRRDTGMGYRAFLETLAKASGIGTPTREGWAKLDQQRPKRGSSQDGVHPEAPEARITKRKDTRTHVAHPCEHAVDLDTEAVVAVTMQTTDGGATASLPVPLEAATEPLAAVEKTPEEGVADKGYPSNATRVALKARPLRSSISEPKRGRRNGTKTKAAPPT